MMKKSIIFIVLLITCHTILKAENNIDVSRWEAEISVGMAGPLGVEKGLHNRVGINLAIEGRYNIKPVPVSISAAVSFSNPCRYSIIYDNEKYEHLNNTYNFTIGAHYDFNRGHKWNPYIGTSVGGAVFPLVQLLVQPRAGIEFNNFLRLSVFSNLFFGKEGFNVWGCSIGYVIGGRPRK